MVKVLNIALITSHPDVRKGRPCIAETGIRVTDIAMATLFHYRKPHEIALDYELSLAQVYAALAYYYEHKTELDEDIRRQLAKARRLKEQAQKAGGSRRKIQLPVTQREFDGERQVAVLP